MAPSTIEFEAADANVALRTPECRVWALERRHHEPGAPVRDTATYLIILAQYVAYF